MKKGKNHYKTRCFVAKIYISEWTGCVKKVWDFFFIAKHKYFLFVTQRKLVFFTGETCFVSDYLASGRERKQTLLDSEYRMLKSLDA